MGTTSAKLLEIRGIVYDGKLCNAVHFGNKCTWAKPCLIHIPEFDRWGPTDYGGITIKRTGGIHTESKAYTFISEGPHDGPYGKNMFGPYTIECFYGDVIETELTHSSYQLYPQNFTVTGDMIVPYEPYKDGPPPGDDDTISFTVGGSSFSTTEGTTWKDFANSNSSFTYYSTGDYVVYSGKGPVAYTNGNLVSGSSTISSGYAYIIAD